MTFCKKVAPLRENKSVQPYEVYARYQYLHLLELIPAIPFESYAARTYAQVRCDAPDRQRDTFDKLIAAHAKSLNLVLVTNNINDFKVFQGLTLENWVEA